VPVCTRCVGLCGVALLVSLEVAVEASRPFGGEVGMVGVMCGGASCPLGWVGAQCSGGHRTCWDGKGHGWMRGWASRPWGIIIPHAGVLVVGCGR